MQEKITTRVVEAIRTRAVQEQREIYCWCDYHHNFGLRAGKSGKVTFLVQIWRRGRAHRVKIDQWPWCTVEKAIEQAAIIRGRIIEGTYKAPTADFTAHTLGDTVEKYLKTKSHLGRHLQQMTRAFNADIVPHFGAKRFVSSITKADIRGYIDTKKENAPMMARLIFSILRTYFDYLVEQDILQISPMDGLKAPTPGQERERYLSAPEIKAYWSAASRIPYPYGPFYKLALLTAARNNTELALMQWSEIEGDVWTIPRSRSKNRKSHIIHLSPLALSVLASIPKTCDYVFSVDGLKPISGFASAKKKLDSLTGQDDYTTHDPRRYTIHDLRRTFVTTAAGSLGVPDYIADRILNHVPKDQRGVKGVYNKTEKLEERREAMLKYGSYIQNLIAS